MKLKWFLLPGFLCFLIFSCQFKGDKKISEEADGAVPARNPFYSHTDTTHLEVSDSEWEKVLPDSIFLVMRKKVTERAFKGKFWNFTGIGVYYCASCGNALFRSDAKFSSSCGWPTFFETTRKNSVRYATDTSHGMKRTEVLCGRCDGHLGHLFKDGPPPTHNRYCMNSIAMEFEPELRQPAN